MRSPLEPLYKLTSFLAAAALVAIAAVILGDVFLRQFGGQIRSSDDYAGFALVATAMLGLAPTYRRGDHIRVGLLIDRLSGASRKAFEFICLTFALVAVIWATWWAAHFTYDSWKYNELSQGLVAIKLWIPQTSMVIGLGVFALALAEDLFRLLTGGQPSYMANASAEPELPTFER